MARATIYLLLIETGSRFEVREIKSSVVAQTVKRLSTMQEIWVDPWVGKIPWRRKWQPTPLLLPGKSHGWRSLVGYSPWGCKELDATKHTHAVSHTLRSLLDVVK